MTTQKRTRIFDILIGLILLFFSIQNFTKVFSLYFPSGIRIELSSSSLLLMLLIVVSCFPPFFWSILIISKKYNKRWAKIGFIISSLIYLIDSSKAYVIVRYFVNDRLREYERSVYSSSELFMIYISWTISVLLFIVGAVVVSLTMFKKLKWKSRKQLLIYTYVMLLLLSITNLKVNSVNFFVLVFLLIPCFMNGGTKQPNQKALIGEAAILIVPFISKAVLAFYSNISDPNNKNASNFFNGPNALIDISRFDVNDMFGFAFLILAFLIPLMLYEREIGTYEESSSSSISLLQKINSILFKNDDEEDEKYEEYENEDEDNDDND